MPSNALQHWLTLSQTQLDEFENAHRLVRGRPGQPGRRYATGQLNHSYLVAVAAQFQRFCRDLHSEAAQHLSAAVPVTLTISYLTLLTNNRKLDSGNAHDGAIGPDFNRLGLAFLQEVDRHNRLNPRRRRSLNQLNAWRNAIVHQDFNFKTEVKTLIGSTQPTLPYVRRWRRNCDLLAKEFDEVVGTYLASVVQHPIW